MRTSLKYLGAASASAMLLACAGTGGVASGPAASPASAQPVQSADGYYVLGRTQHAAGRLDDAFKSYQLALRVEPRHTNARNGLAVLYAGRGDYASAIGLWQGLTAQTGEVGGPERAFLFSNLGYAYYLSGQHRLALEALEKACLLDPSNALSWDHLAVVLGQLGQDERAAAMRRQAQTLYGHDAKADYALAGRAPTVSAAATAQAQVQAQVQAQAQAQAQAPSGAAWPQAMARTEVTQEGALVQVRRVSGRPAEAVPMRQTVVPPAPAVSPLSPPARAPAPGEKTPLPLARAAQAVAAVETGVDTPARVRLEISNGNGVTGMAAALARTVGGGRLQVIRLANERPFLVARTRVEYRPQQAREARELAARLGPTVLTEQVQVKAADVRLVLGHDLTDPVALHRHYLKELQLARMQLARLGEPRLAAR